MKKNIVTAVIAITAALGLGACGDSPDSLPNSSVNGYTLHWEKMDGDTYTACDTKHGNRLYKDDYKSSIAAVKDESCKGPSTGE